MAGGFDTGFARIEGRFGRVEPRRQARTFLLGLLADVATRSCWQLAEQAGDTSPRAMQRLLGEAVWDADKVRDDLRGYVVDAVGDPAGVLIIDDTGDLKKGCHSVGVQRHYTGTAGRIGNAQVAVFCGYATPRGYTLIDREIYLPRCWADDPARRTQAGVPDEVRFATKIARGCSPAPTPPGYPRPGPPPTNSTAGTGSYAATCKPAGSATSWPWRKATGSPPGRSTARSAPPRLAANLPARAWNRISAGTGAKGHRDYDWAWITIIAPVDEAAGQHTLRIRRRISDGELAFYRCWSPRPVPLRVLVTVAGTRWRIETCFQTGKAIDLDEHQVRRWDSWYRHTTLVMLAHAILAAIAARERAQSAPDQMLIPLTVPEIRRLFARLIANTIHTIDHWAGLVDWRRRHQARARTSHYRRRGHTIH